MRKLFSIVALALSLFWATPEARADVGTSTASVTAVAIAADATEDYKVKGCILSNDTALGTSVVIKDGTTAKAQISASSYTTVQVSDFSKLLGEELVIDGAFNVTSSTASALVLLTCGYEKLRN